MRPQIIIENDLLNIKDLKNARKAFSILSGCPEILIDIYVQGIFKIKDRSPLTNELNLYHRWYKVSKIGSRFMTIYIADEEKSYRAKPYVTKFSTPGFRMCAEIFNALSLCE